jgi:hypothetical protein
MNLNLTPQQFLAIYDSLSSDATSSKEVKHKMNSMLLDALSIVDDSKNQNKFGNWIKQEKEKVEGLQTELKSIRNPAFDDGLLFPPPLSK